MVSILVALVDGAVSAGSMRLISSLSMRSCSLAVIILLFFSVFLATACFLLAKRLHIYLAIRLRLRCS